MMARLEDLTPAMAQRLRELDCPAYASAPFVIGSKLSSRRVAVVSSAGIHRRGEPPMMPGANEFRELPAALSASDIVMTHVSVNYDRTGFQRDINTVYPIDRLRELAAEGVIGSVADTHYAVMGANDPKQWDALADQLADRLRQDRVDAVLLSPV
jgi:D-proline reductase (dithiol) PrdB